MTAALLVVAVPLHGAPKIRFEARAVIAEKVTPGATTAWLAVAHETQPYHLRVREYAQLIEDDDRDGIVRFDVKRGVARESVWVVIDMTTGDWTTAEPVGGKIRVKPLKPPKITPRTNGKPSTLTQDDAHLKFWLVRPGRGAWVQTGIDGEIGDEDGTPDGRTTAALERFTPVGSSPAPPEDLERGDILIVIDPFKLRLFESRVRE